MTAESLNALTRKELASRAKKRGITGWHGMRKRELVQALLSVGRKSGRGNTNGHGKSGAGRGPKLAIREGDRGGADRDHLVAEVQDSHWIKLTWNLSSRIVARAESSLGSDWHTARPVVRVMDVTSEEAGTEQTQHIRDIEITNGDAETWYVPLDDPTRTYRLHLGYLAGNGRFFSAARSRKVTLPKPGSSNRMRRPGIVSRKSGRVPIPASSEGRGEAARFEIEAELVVQGKTDPSAQLTLLGEPVELDADGFFSLRVSLPEGRQVIPVVSVSPTGDEQRTIVLAIERNTKELEPESLVEA